MTFDKNKKYPLFISHCWDYNKKYYTVVDWINESDINWRNMSVPNHDPLNPKTDKELEILLDNRIKNSSLFIIIAGMYISYDENRIWINKEIEIAEKYNKNILAIKPWGNKKTPFKIQAVADKIVNWNSTSVINGIKELLWVQKIQF